MRMLLFVFVSFFITPFALSQEAPSSPATTPDSPAETSSQPPANPDSASKDSDSQTQAPAPGSDGQPASDPTRPTAGEAAPSATPAEPTPAAPADSSSGSLFDTATSTPSDSGSGSGGASSPSAGSPLELSGYVRGDLFLSGVELSGDQNIPTALGELALKVKRRFGEHGAVQAEIRGNHGHEKGETRSKFLVREAFVDAYLGNLDVRFGEQIIVWGRADGINPTDNLGAQDMSSNVTTDDDRRIPNLALRLKFHSSPMTFEGVYVPFYQPTLQPPFELPSTLLTMGAEDYPKKTLGNGALGLKLDVEMGSLDFSVSCVYGYAPIPGLGYKRDGLPAILGQAYRYFTGSVSGEQLVQSAISNGSDNWFEVQWRAYRQVVVGADFSTTLFDKYGLRGEVALRIPDRVKDGDEHVPQRDLYFVLGMDRIFSENFVVIAEYIGRKVLGWETIPESALTQIMDGETPSATQLASLLVDFQEKVDDEFKRQNRTVFMQQHAFTHSALARVEVKALQQALTLEVAGMYNFTTKEWTTRPSLAYLITDGLVAKLGAELYHGPKNTLFDRLDNSLSVVYIEMKAFF